MQILVIVAPSQASTLKADVRGRVPREQHLAVGESVLRAPPSESQQPNPASVRWPSTGPAVLAGVGAQKGSRLTFRHRGAGAMRALVRVAFTGGVPARAGHNARQRKAVTRRERQAG